MSAATITGGGTINGNGTIARCRFQGIAASATVDITKLNFLCSRPGYNRAKTFSAANIVSVIGTTGVVRQPFANQALQLVNAVVTDLDVYIALTEDVFASDTITSVAVTAGFYGACTTSTLSVGTNSSTRAYPMPQFSWLGVEDWERWTSAGIALEGIVDHWGARDGQPVAAVDYYGTDGINTSTVSKNTMSLSARVPGPNKVGCFAATLPQGSLTQGEVGIGAIIYPWVGDATWDTNSGAFDAWPTANTPKLHLTNLDTDGSYAPVGSYVSHTGSAIGTPSIGLVSAMGAYVPGTTPAYASVSTLATAAKAYNASGSRTRTHGDLAGAVAVIPSGTTLTTLGASMSSQATYPGGLGLFRLTIEAGASKSNTGMGTNSNPPPSRFMADGIGIFPGASGGATHTVFDFGGGGAPSSQPTKAAAIHFTAKNCSGTGNNDNTFAVFARAGYRRYINCNFTSFGDDVVNGNAGLFNGVVALHGGTIDHRPNTAAALAQSSSIAGCQLWSCAIADLAAGASPDILGRMVHSVRADKDFASGSTLLTSTIGMGRAVGVRGESWVNTLLRMTRTGATAGALGAGEGPVINISGDFAANLDRPAIQNINIAYCSFIGSRRNGPYNEAGGGSVGAVYVEKRLRERFSAYSERSCKGDLMDTDGAGTAGAPSAIRMGIIAYRYGTSLFGIVVGENSANGTPPSPSCWLGEVAWPGSSIDVGSGNLFTSDTSLMGSNSFASVGDYSPKTALLNRVPSGMAATGWDQLGNARKNSGTGAAGAIEGAGGATMTFSGGQMAMAGTWTLTPGAGIAFAGGQMTMGGSWGAVRSVAIGLDGGLMTTSGTWTLLAPGPGGYSFTGPRVYVASAADVNFITSGII